MKLEGICTDTRSRGGVPQPLRLTPAASGWLDAIRALAALTVVFGHCRGLFFVDYGDVHANKATSCVKAIYAITGFGHQSVMVFFVLSGFFISSSILRNLGRQTWSWREYIIDRSVRLYVVLIPGLILGFIWDMTGILCFNRTGIYSRPLVPFGYGIPACRLGLATLTCNLLFLQTRFAPVFGSNGPLWSLFNEFWYYALFPLMVATILSARKRAIRRTVGYLLLACITTWILGSQLLGFLVWLAGAGVALTSRYARFGDVRKWRVAVYSLSTGGVFGVCLLASRASDPWVGSDLAVGFSFALLMHGILQVHIPIGGFGLMLARAFAGFSYSLYVLHFPVLFFVRAKWLPAMRWQPDTVHLVYGFCIGACAVLYAFIVARVTERNTSALRAWLRNVFA